MNTVQTWFGEDFGRLHPALQGLHSRGGTLTGNVEIRYGTGLAGVIGKRLARMLNIPTNAGQHGFSVDIRHGEDGLHWNRRFDGKATMHSLFKAVGTRSNGWWIEDSGPVRMQ